MEYMTATEFAIKNKVSRRTVCFWIETNQIVATKFGKAWMIPSETERPVDRRLVENPIRNRRKNRDI